MLRLNGYVLTLVVALLLSAIGALLQPEQASALVTGVKDALVDGYILAYLDRATWITGCF